MRPPEINRRVATKTSAFVIEARELARAYEYHGIDHTENLAPFQ